MKSCFTLYNIGDMSDDKAGPTWLITESNPNANASSLLWKYLAIMIP